MASEVSLGRSYTSMGPHVTVTRLWKEALPSCWNKKALPEQRAAVEARKNMSRLAGLKKSNRNCRAGFR